MTLFPAKPKNLNESTGIRGGQSDQGTQEALGHRLDIAWLFDSEFQPDHPSVL